MSVLSRFLARDALAAAVVAGVMAMPAPSDAAASKPVPQKTPVARSAPIAAKPASVPLSLRVSPQQRQKDEEARLAGIRKAYDGLVGVRNTLQDGTRICMKDQRWLLMKVRDSFYDNGAVPTPAYLDGAVERVRAAAELRTTQLAASRTAAEAPLPVPDAGAPPSRAAMFAEQSDVDRLRESVERLQWLRTSCLVWAERSVDQAIALTRAPLHMRLDRLREAMAVAARDYKAMHDITPDSARDALARMGEPAEEPAATFRVGSL